MPFGFVQMMVCVVGCVIAARWGHKGIVFACLMIPCLIGSGLLYGEVKLWVTPPDITGLGRAKSDEGPLLFGYYCLGKWNIMNPSPQSSAFLFGGNPLIFSWVAANTAGESLQLRTTADYVGHTKKSLSKAVWVETLLTLRHLALQCGFGCRQHRREYDMQ